MSKNSLKSQSGITMISLIIYVASFLTVTVVVGFITTFFYNNVVTINSNLGSTSGYDAFNNCMLSEVKRADAKIASAKSSGVGINNNYTYKGNKYSFASFKYKSNVMQPKVDDDGNEVHDDEGNVIMVSATVTSYSVFLYDKTRRVLYYNYSVLCKNVDDFSSKTYKDASGKEVLETFIKINDIPFRTTYVLNNYK